MQASVLTHTDTCRAPALQNSAGSFACLRQDLSPAVACWPSSCAPLPALGAVKEVKPHNGPRRPRLQHPADNILSTLDSTSKVLAMCIVTSGRASSCSPVICDPCASCNLAYMPATCFHAFVAAMGTPGWGKCLSVRQRLELAGQGSHLHRRVGARCRWRLPRLLKLDPHARIAC